MFKDFKKMEKEKEKELNDWRAEMMQKFIDFQQENKCVLVPTMRQIQQNNPDVWMCGFVVMTEEERKNQLGIKQDENK